jgi:hypothetical protein
MRQGTSYKYRFLAAPAASVALIVAGGAAPASAATTLVAQHSNKCLDVTGGPGATQDGASLEQWPCTGQLNQSWTLNDAGGGQYELVASHSNKCAEVVNGGTANGSLVRQAACTREPKQLWRLRSKASAPNRFEVVNVPSHRCLDVTGGPQGIQDGNLIELWNCNGTTNQAWTLAETPTSRPTQVVARHSGKCLDVTGGPGATQAGAPIEQWKCTGALNQNWTIRDAGAGRVQLVAQHSNRCLDTVAGGTDDGTGLQQGDCSTASTQLWTVQGLLGTPGEYALVNVASNRCAGIVTGGATMNDGAAAELRDCGAASPNQLWTIRAYAAGTRDARQQPFASDSIWNTPIGSGAQFVPSKVSPTPGQYLPDPKLPDQTWADMPHLDHENIVLHPEAAPLSVEYTHVGIGTANKCAPTNDAPPNAPFPMLLPIPADYVVPSNNGNGSTTILKADGHTLAQMQPFALCTAGGPATSKVWFADADLFKDGRVGAHGGSKLSALGGSIRVGELRPLQHAPRHAIKVNVYSQEVFHDCGPDVGITCYRWPASSADGKAPTQYGIAPGITPPLGMKMGALLAIPPSVDIGALGLRTDPGRQLAWTLQNFGAYVVDSTGGAAFGLNVEDGAFRAPNGEYLAKDDEFDDDYAPLTMHSRVRTNSDWSRDIQTLVSNLYLVDNNGENAVGGGGMPRQPFLPPLP